MPEAEHENNQINEACNEVEPAQHAQHAQLSHMHMHMHEQVQA